jgi:uroporphyrinogen decarboxylase
LDGKLPLIGFAAAPFTLACYMVEGGGSKDFARLRRLCWERPVWMERLLSAISDMTIRHLTAQVEAGAAAIQLFESWAGALPPGLYSDIVAPQVARIMRAIEGLGVPRIIYAGHTGQHLESLATLPIEVLSVDWRMPISRVTGVLPDHVAVQGNLDPCALGLDADRLRAEAEKTLAEIPPGRSHIFNLGHGIHPGVDPDNVAHLVDVVHAWSPSGSNA